MMTFLVWLIVIVTSFVCGFITGFLVYRNNIKTLKENEAKLKKTIQYISGK